MHGKSGGDKMASLSSPYRCQDKGSGLNTMEKNYIFTKIAENHPGYPADL